MDGVTPVGSGGYGDFAAPAAAVRASSVRTAAGVAVLDKAMEIQSEGMEDILKTLGIGENLDINA
jgi:hypothetical protein